MKCDCCKIRNAVVKDCRIEYGQTQKYFVCGNCVMLADVDFFRLFSLGY